MTSKLKDVFVLNESVVDKTKVTGGGPNTLSALGVNVQEIRSLGDLQQALYHIHSRMMLGLKSVEAKVSSVQDVPEEVKKALTKVQSALDDLRQAAVSSTPEQPPEQGDPAKGWADDPNPETRGSQHPYRGRRSG